MNLKNENIHRKTDTREGMIVAASVLGIVVNLLIAAVKVVLGALTGSIAIVSEGANNATDALSSVLTLLGTKLAGRHPDRKHPFGYRRIEYLTGIVVGVLILVTGLEMLISSVKLIFHPEELSVSYLSVAVIAVSALAKFLLGLYTIRIGKKTGSSALEAVGIESRNDSYASVITIVSALIWLLFRVSVDAYAGIIISALIMKAGYDVLRETLSDLIGRVGEKELADRLYEEIRSTDGIIGAADMMLHNYGPDTWSGSVNIEIDHKKTVGEIYQFIHALQLRIMHEYGVVMVFGLYAVDNDNEQIKAIREAIGAFAGTQGHIVSYHAVYLEPETDRIYCDFVVDYELKDWDGLKRAFIDYMKERYPQSEIELTVETEYV